MKRLSGLDALRGLAALLVAASHFNALVLKQGYIPGAGLAVDFFFMLSGFIMARTYDGKMPAPVAFIALRARRLWPAFALGTVIGAAVTKAPLVYLPAALLFLPVPGNPFVFNPPAWSLFFELVANAVHSALRSNRRLVLLIVLVTPSWFIATLDGANAAHSWARMPEGFLRVGMAYFMGVLLWRFNPAWKVPAWVGPLTFVPCVLLPLAYHPFIIAALFPLAILSGQRWEAGSAGDWAGRLSYPLYAIHFPIMLLPLSWPAIVALVVASVALATWIDGLRKGRQSYPLGNAADGGVKPAV